MSELNNSVAQSGQNAATTSHNEKLRLIKDAVMRHVITVGGLSTICAVVVIFFYLLYVVYPLFLSASAEPITQYQIPSESAGKTLFLNIEEQNEVASRFTDSGAVIFFEAKTGKILAEEKVLLPEGTSIVSSVQGTPMREGAIAYGLSNGQAIIVKQQYKMDFVDNKRTIIPSLSYPLGEAPLVVDESGAALDRISFKIGESSTVIVAKTANKLHIASFEKEQSLFAEDSALIRSDSVLEMPVGTIKDILIDKEEHNVFVMYEDGLLNAVDISKKSNPEIKQQMTVIKSGEKVTSISFLNGDLSLMIGDSTGLVSQWGLVRDKSGKSMLEKIRVFKVSDSSIVAINASEQRRKGFMTIDDKGEMGVYHSTSERLMIKAHVSDSTPLAVILSPRANTLLLQNHDGKIHFWNIDNEHPEVSMKSLWQKVWYESYPQPAYIWQSSSASDDFEPKYSLTPLVFGTLKAAFYAMLVAIPLSLMGAIYAAYFMSPKMRVYVKPTIEIMGALPTVILGFLAGLWLAPFIEAHLSGLFSVLVIVPLTVVIFALSFQTFLPEEMRKSIPDGWEAAILIPVILIGGWFAFSISVPLETFLFHGTLRDWFKNEFGIGYDQRNALVVGIAMGFAVVPTIFSIAEDAIFGVPKHLTTGSLALGATTWQTMSRVVLLTASPGIFSGIMIGFGRAVGETMIVLMATGNTPVMDLSVFQGLRTLAANIAVEMPETEVDSTHYRVLFLAALVLFMFTFVFNTLAEIVRQRLREKYSSL